MAEAKGAFRLTTGATAPRAPGLPAHGVGA